MGLTNEDPGEGRVTVIKVCVVQMRLIVGGDLIISDGRSDDLVF